MMDEADTWVAEALGLRSWAACPWWTSVLVPSAVTLAYLLSVVLLPLIIPAKQTTASHPCAFLLVLLA